MVHQSVKAGPLLLCLVALGAGAASFDCSKDLTTVERLVCSDVVLSRADEDLAAAYEEAVRSSPRPETVRHQQRAWLNDVRNRCKDATCLKTAYYKRTQALSVVGDWMTHEKAQKICSGVVQAINGGSIRNRFLKFQPATDAEQSAWQTTHPNLSSLYLWRSLKAEHKGVTRTFGLLQGGGTCGSCDIVDIKAREVSVSPADEEDEDLRWAGWGQCDQLMYLMGEPIVVTGRFDRVASRATLVSWLAPDGAKRALCSLEPTTTVNTITERANNQAMCRAAATSAVKFLPWTETVSLPAEQQAVLGIPVDSGQAAHVDINLDGKREVVALFDYASGAGCGSSHQWLVVLTSEGRVVADSALNKLLLSRQWGPIEGRGSVTDKAASARLFEYEGQPYLFGRGTETSASVYSFWHDRTETWCEYRLLPQHRVKRYYPTAPESRRKQQQ